MHPREGTKSSALHQGSSATEPTFTPTIITALTNGAKRVLTSSRDLRGGPRWARQIGPERDPSTPIGHTWLDDSRVIHADDEERGAARPPERVARIRHENDAAGYNEGLRGCYSMPPRATEEDVSASFSASSSSSSSWRRRDPTRWRKASSGKMLRVLAEGQILTKRGQHRR